MTGMCQAGGFPRRKAADFYVREGRGAKLSGEAGNRRETEAKGGASRGRGNGFGGKGLFCFTPAVRQAIMSGSS